MIISNNCFQFSHSGRVLFDLLVLGGERYGRCFEIYNMKEELCGLEVGKGRDVKLKLKVWISMVSDWGGYCIWYFVCLLWFSLLNSFYYWKLCLHPTFLYKAASMIFPYAFCIQLVYSVGFYGSNLDQSLTFVVLYMHHSVGGFQQ